MKQDSVSDARAIAFVALIQTFLLADVAGLAINVVWMRSALFQYHKTAGLLFAAIGGVLMLLNFIKYNNHYNEFHATWKDEPHNKKFFKGILIMLSFILPLVILALLSHMN